MSKYLLFLATIFLMAFSCQTQQGHTYFVIKDRKNRSIFHLNDTLQLTLSGTRNGHQADSAEWLLNGKVLQRGERLDLPASALGLGSPRISVRAWHKGKQYDSEADVVILSDVPPASYSYKLVRSYPHDTAAYTQGLFYLKGQLYEGTGRKGQSVIRITGLDGKTRKQVRLPDDIFGEGICLLGDTVYQLSWKARKGFLYTPSLEKLGEFPYPEIFDGWGLTTDGRYLILSDGSHRLRFLDPADSMRVVKTLEVFDNKQAVKNLNELEYVDGVVYANVYTKDHIVGIDASSGKVVLQADLSGLLPETARYPGFDNYNNVLNGIAYDPESGHFYLTGKKWPYLYEVRLLKADSLALR